MKITIKKKMPALLHLNPRHKTKHKLIDKIIDIPDDLLDKTIAVIDELLDRTCEDNGNSPDESWTDVNFPLVPFPFFTKNRLSENIGIDDSWVLIWLDTKLQNAIMERSTIINILYNLEGIDVIKHDPVINMITGHFDGDQFSLSIVREKLWNLRKMIREEQKKIKHTADLSEVKPIIVATANLPAKQAVSKQNEFTVSVKDREIWINDCLVGKPHAVGSNFEFFEYVRSKPHLASIKRNELPTAGIGSSLKEEIQNKSFIKILNALGFKGEILKAFFPKRGKDALSYQGDKITVKDLEEAGVKIPIFLQELKLAHSKNSPE